MAYEIYSNTVQAEACSQRLLMDCLIDPYMINSVYGVCEHFPSVKDIRQTHIQFSAKFCCYMLFM